MTTQREPRQIVADALYNAFHTDTRDNGETFYKLREDAPEWMRDAIRAAHDAVDEMPDDDVYECCRDAAGFLSDWSDWGGDVPGEFADGQVSAYNAERIEWLAKKPLKRGPLCDEAAEEYGQTFDGKEWNTGIFQFAAIGWLLWADRIIRAIAEACTEVAEEMAEADEADED